jgi:hypothetical protein
MEQLRPIGGIMGLIELRSDDELLLNLRPNVIYPILQDSDGDGGTGKILAKVIDISGRKTYRPNNATAAVLLYLLARDDGDDVLLSDYIDFIKVTLPSSVRRDDSSWAEIETSIITFLKKLESVYKVLKITLVHKGTQGASDLDPVGMVSSLTTWDYELELILRAPPIVKKNTCYSTGYRVVPR